MLFENKIYSLSVLHQILLNLSEEQQEELDCKIGALEELIELERSFHETDEHFTLHPFIIYHNETGFDQTAEKLGLHTPKKFIGRLDRVFENWSESCSERYGKFMITNKIIEDLCMNHYKIDLNAVSVPQPQNDIIPKAVPDLHQNMEDFLSFCIGCYFRKYTLNNPRFLSSDSIQTIEQKLQISKPYLQLNGEFNTTDSALNWIIFLVKSIYGEKSLKYNMDFIGNALSNKEDNPIHKIKTYLLYTFLSEHEKDYGKNNFYKRYEKDNGSIYIEPVTH